MAVPSVSPALFFLLVVGIVGSMRTCTRFGVVARNKPTRDAGIVICRVCRRTFVGDHFNITYSRSMVLFIVLVVLATLRFELRGGIAC